MKKYGKLMSVCDVKKEHADSFSLEFETKAFYNIEDFLASEVKSDIVAVCTPNGLHANHCIRLLESGMNVLCEKPMAISARDCQTMIDCAKKNSRKIFLVKQNRYNPPVLELKKMIDERRLGDIYSLQLNCFWNRDAHYYKDSWRGSMALDGGTLYTQFSHFIDLLYWLFGDVQDMKAILSNYAHKGIIEFEDTGMVLLKFQNGITGTLNYTVNSHGKNMEGSLTVFGEKGTVKVGGQYLNNIEFQDIQDYTMGPIDPGNAPNVYAGYKGSMSNHEKVYENIIQYLEGKESVYINSEDGLKTVSIIERIYKSADKMY
jgi:predicted dehydrogenase